MKPKKKTITVPKPIQLPSGEWRIQLRKESISITRSSRDKCIADAKAARIQWEKDEAAGLHIKPQIVTLNDVVTAYIEAKTPVLSASTIKAYNSYANHRFQAYMQSDVNTLNPQEMINAEIEANRSPKSIINAWGLIHSALRFAGITVSQPSLPRRLPKERNWLDYNQIKTFLSAIQGQPCELVCLLALHSLRRSEIFGLRLSDYDRKNKIIHVRGAMLNTGAGWERTSLNKNDTSRRDVPVIIPRLNELLSKIKTEYIIPNPSEYVCVEINKICRQYGLPEAGVHGLRHSFASLAYHLNWKKLSTMQIGGWRTSKVLDSIYTHNADLEDDLTTMREYYRE